MNRPESAEIKAERVGNGWARGEPVALTLTALAPQLFRDLVVRSHVSRFTVNKKAQNNQVAVTDASPSPPKCRQVQTLKINQLTVRVLKTAIRLTGKIRSCEE